MDSEVLHFLFNRLEVLPNRNSLLYADLYGIPEARTVFRGTLRYQVRALASLGTLLVPGNVGTAQS